MQVECLALYVPPFSSLLLFNEKPSTDNSDPFVLIYRGHTLLVLRDQKAKSEAFFSVVNPLAYTGRCLASVDVLLPSLQYREIAISSKNTSIATYNLYPVSYHLILSKDA